MRSLVASAIVLACTFSSQAHRLDEYLQATRITLAMNQIELAIDLTPGVSIAQELLQSIDPNGGVRIGSNQGTNYAQRVIQDLVLDLDGKRQQIRLSKATFPARADMSAGEGTIHVHAVAKISTLKPGQHELFFRNSHLNKISVYLVNALVPVSKSIQITNQSRDNLQKEYRLSFEVKPVKPKAP